LAKRLWNLSEYPFHPERLLYYETIFTIGNGYLGTRASFEEGYPGETPGTLVHGIYDHAPEMQVPELANIPDWLPIRITIDGTPFQLITTTDNILSPSQGIVLGYRRTLELDRGLLRREVLFRAASGSTVRIVFERFASLADIHVLAQRVSFTVVDGAPEITVEAVLNGDVHNNGVRHWKDLITHQDGRLIGIEAKTQQSGYHIGMSTRLVSPEAVTTSTDELSSTAKTVLKMKQGDKATIDKLTAIYTSRDVEQPMATAYTRSQGFDNASYDKYLAEHEAAWAKYWDDSDIQIEGDEGAQVAIRFTTYHVLIAAPHHSDDVSIGAKTLSGMGYKGHVFWDTELFILPPLTLTQPHIARNLLMYRYKRLDGARRKAKAGSYEGAMFPWESTDTGEETTPQWSDPFPDGSRIRIWTGDSEQHISTDISYAVLQYWRWTGDDKFLTNYGAEIVLDTAKFWGSRVESKNGRYELSQQIGPDEYHENIDNSAFTNRMVVWHLDQALKLLDWLHTHAPQDADRLIGQLDLNPQRLDHWRDVMARMYIPFDEAKQHHIEFDGFFDLEYIPVQDYEPRVGGVWPMIGHKRALASQVIKQADVVMLMALLGDELASREVMLNNWNTYYPRTDHGSSLSPAVHAWVAARLGLIDDALYLFQHAAAIDLEDNKGNVRDGIHGAASGGLWQAIVFGFCGLHLTDNGPKVDPLLPAHWKKVSFNVYYRGEKQSFAVTNPALVPPTA
jgi:trehalose/maltose hydrolase-like predicted phosphorylase